MIGVTTDYEHAGRLANRYLSVLRLERGAALILGDRPLITGVWRNALNQVVIWRVSYAEPDEDVVDLLASLTERAFAAPIESLEFSFGSGDVIIFDTSLPGKESDEESVAFNIRPGRYLVTTHEVRPSPSSEFLLHRFY